MLKCQREDPLFNGSIKEACLLKKFKKEGLVLENWSKKKKRREKI
jgi:hypothetical protein